MIYATYDLKTNSVVSVSTSKPSDFDGYASIGLTTSVNVGDKIVSNEVMPAPPAEADVEAFRKQQLALVQTRRDAFLAAGVSTPFGTIQADVASRANITEALNVSLSNPATFSITWRMADNSMVTLNGLKMAGVAQAVHVAVDATYAKAFKMKDAIKAAPTLEKIKGILIDFSA